MTPQQGRHAYTEVGTEAMVQKIAPRSEDGWAKLGCTALRRKRTQRNRPVQERQGDSILLQVGGTTSWD